jgi:TRAP-type mannitol/chloroaromatic compound transport system permease small subunit
MYKLSNIIDNITRVFAILSAILIVALSLLVVYDALNRYLFHGGSVALQELEWHLFDIIFLTGLSYTLLHDSHVRVDIFYSKFSDKTKAIVNIFSHLFLIIPFALMIVYMSYPYIMMSFDQNEISSDPGGLCCRYLIKSMIIFGFSLLALQSLSEVFKNIRSLKGS